MNNASMQIGSAISLAALVSLGASQAAESPPARPAAARPAVRPADREEPVVR